MAISDLNLGTVLEPIQSIPKGLTCSFTLTAFLVVRPIVRDSDVFPVDWAISSIAYDR